MVRQYLDNMLSENVQNIRQSCKLYQGSHEKLYSVIDVRCKNISVRKNPLRHLPGRCHCITYLGSALRVTKLQIHKKRLIILCTWMSSSYLQNTPKEWETLIQTIRIYSQDIGIEFVIGNVACS